MTKSKLARAAAFLAAFAGATTAHADPPNVNGSDTLEPLISALIAPGGACSTAALSYVGGGSGTAGTAMINALPTPTATFSQLAGAQSRAINASECSGGIAKDPSVQSTAEGVVIGLDGILVVTDDVSSVSCGGGHADRGPSHITPPSASGFSDMKLNQGWKRTLRVLYTGFDGTSNGKCKDTENAERAALAESYASLFEGGCTAGTCTGIVRAFRRGDASGTTDTFLSLIGAPGVTRDPVTNRVTATPFCNGLDSEDKDPIRRSCSQDEQVCEADGKLGLVVPIVTPTSTNDLGELYGESPAGTCSAPFGKLKPALGTSCIDPPPPMTDPTMVKTSPCTGNVVYNLPADCAFPNTPRCDCRFPTPSDFANARKISDPTQPCTGAPFIANNEFKWNTRAGGCPAPVLVTGTTTAWNYLNGDDGTRDNSPAHWGTRSVQTVAGMPGWRPSLPTAQRCCSLKCAGATTNTFLRQDVRVQNLAWRTPTNGRIRDFANAVPVTFTPAFYRIHADTYGLSVIGQANPCTPVCQKVDATELIGCLVRNPMACNVGFAGREAWTTAGAEPLAIGNAATAIDPTTTNLVAQTYPLERKLYWNSLVGFGSSQFTNATLPNVSYRQGLLDLTNCIKANGAAYRTTLTSKGFVDLDPTNPNPVEAMCP